MRVGLKSRTSTLTRLKGKRCAERRLCEAGGRDGKAAVTAKEARSHQKLKEAKEAPPVPWNLWREHSLVWI